jgi:hypothetical protein
MTNYNTESLQEILPPYRLKRTYKAYCRHCYGISSTYDPKDRTVPCHFCIYILKIQKVSRGFLVRNKVRKIKKIELIHRWFMGKHINGKDICYDINLFL